MSQSGFDMGQRYIECEITGWQSTPWPPPPLVPGGCTFRAPPSSAHAPRGFYQLFVVTNAGVPSDARWVEFL